MQLVQDHVGVLPSLCGHDAEDIPILCLQCISSFLGSLTVGTICLAPNLNFDASRPAWWRAGPMAAEVEVPAERWGMAAKELEATAVIFF